MKSISILLLLLLPMVAVGQRTPGKLRITRQHYYRYAFQDRQCYPDNAAVTDDRTSNEADSVFADVTEISYPVVHTSQPALSRSINSTIRKLAGVNGPGEASPRDWRHYACLADKPAEKLGNYVLHFVNGRYLSFTLTAKEEAGGGASGWGDYRTAVTFDLQRRTALVLKDVVQRRYDQVIYRIAMAHLKATAPELFTGQWEESMNPMLFSFTSTLDRPIAVQKDRIVFYWEVYWGAGRVSYEAVNLSFNRYAYLFADGFIAAVRKK